VRCNQIFTMKVWSRIYDNIVYTSDKVSHTDLQILYIILLPHGLDKNVGTLYSVLSVFIKGCGQNCLWVVFYATFLRPVNIVIYIPRSKLVQEVTFIPLFGKGEIRMSGKTPTTPTECSRYSPVSPDKLWVATQTYLRLSYLLFVLKVYVMHSKLFNSITRSEYKF
jgi:hypothetical protein